MSLWRIWWSKNSEEEGDGDRRRKKRRFGEMEGALLGERGATRQRPVLLGTPASRRSAHPELDVDPGALADFLAGEANVKAKGKAKAIKTKYSTDQFVNRFRRNEASRSTTFIAAQPWCHLLRVLIAPSTSGGSRGTAWGAA